MSLLRKLLLEKEGKRGPFLRPPLNVPGASLRERLDEKCDSLAQGLIVGPLALLGVLVFFFMLRASVSPYFVCGIILAAWLCWLIFRGQPLLEEVRTARLGYLGEVVVGQELERTRALGCSVYHDIVNDAPAFNIDHVLISESGVMVVETKAKSKPIEGEVKIRHRSGRLEFSDGGYSEKELEQARRNAGYVRKLLCRLIRDGNKVSLERFVKGDSLPLEACLVYPGWHVDYRSAIDSDVHLSNDKMLYNFVASLCRRPPRFSLEEANDLNALLEAYLRQKKAHLIEV